MRTSWGVLSLFVFIILTHVPVEADNNYNDLVVRADSLFWVGELIWMHEVAQTLTERFPDSSEGYRFMAIHWFIENDWDKSIDFGEEALERNENSGMAHQWLGRAFGRKAGESSRFRKMMLVGKIRKHFEKAAELMPDFLNAHLDLFTFYDEAPAFVGGSEENLMKTLADIERIDPKKATELRARLYLKMDQVDKAQIEMLKVIDMEPENISPRWHFAYSMMAFDPVASRNQLRLIMLISPRDSVRAMYQIAKTYLLAGDSLEVGIETMTWFLAQDATIGTPPKAAAYWRRGMLYENHGQFDKAFKDYNDCLRLDANYSEGKKALKRLRKKMR